jgi:RNA polymerase sigma-70 factor (ECF subfamily)
MSDEPADGQIVRAVLAGDVEQFGVLVRRCREEFGRAAVALAGDADSGADALQDSLIRAWRALDTCRDPDRFRAWFYRILVNRCHDMRRRRSPVVPLEFVADPPSREQADARIRDDELARVIAAALDRLTPEQREAFVMKEIEGRSYQEMAELLETGVDALKMRVHRARDGLRALLEGYR